MSNLSSNNQPADDKKSQVISILELLATRLQWTPAKHVLSASGLHASRGWDETINHLRSAFYDKKIWDEAHVRLSELAILHSRVGNKRVSFYDLRELNSDERNRIIKWACASAKNDLKSILAGKPFGVLDAPVHPEYLDEYKNCQPFLVAAWRVKEKLFMQFFSARSYTHRESIDISKMGVSQQSMFKDFSELIGVRAKSVPCFDTVAIDVENELMEVRVDFQPGMSEDKKIPACGRVIDEFSRILIARIGQVTLTPGLVDLYPAISPLYRDKECGQVTALGFVAVGSESSSNNTGKIHRSKIRDFRNDEFHVGGKENVEKIEPYAIGISWARQLPQSELYLELKGSAKSIYKRALNPVSVAEVVGCLDSADFEFVSKQLLSRLKRKKSGC